MSAARGRIWIEAISERGPTLFAFFQAQEEGVTVIALAAAAADCCLLSKEKKAKGKNAISNLMPGDGRKSQSVSPGGVCKTLEYGEEGCVAESLSAFSNFRPLCVSEEEEILQEAGEDVCASVWCAEEGEGEGGTTLNLERERISVGTEGPLFFFCGSEREI